MHDLLMDLIFHLSEAQQALIMFGAMVLMIVLAVPIPIAVAIGTAIGYFMMDLNLVQVALSMYTGVEPFPLVTVPLFVFAGSLMEQGGMARRIVNMAQSMIGNYTGSLGLVAVLGCAFFAALSGSGPATTAAIGAVMIPSMIKQRWDPAMGGAIAAAGGALGSLIPPSNLMIIYGIVAEQSIPRLFLAGFIPGFVATALLMVTVYIIAKRRNYTGDGVEFSWAEVRRTTLDGKWAILAPFVILGGIYSGAFTPRSRCSCRVLCITDRRCGLSRTYDQEDTRVFEGYSNDFWRSSYYCWACQGVWRVDESFVGARYDWRCSLWSDGKPVFIADDHICDIDNHRYVPGVYRSDYSFDTLVTANCCCIGNRPNRFWYSYGYIM